MNMNESAIAYASGWYIFLRIRRARRVSDALPRERSSHAR
jgi:hypothetical protein